MPHFAIGALKRSVSFENKTKLVILRTTLRASSQLLSTFRVFGPLQKCSFMCCYEQLRSTLLQIFIAYISFRNDTCTQAGMDLHSMTVLFLNYFYRQGRIHVSDPCWLVYFSNFSFDVMLQSYQEHTIHYTHGGESASIHEQLKQICSLCGRVVSTCKHDSSFFATLTQLCIHHLLIHFPLLQNDLPTPRYCCDHGEPVKAHFILWETWKAICITVFGQTIMLPFKYDYFLSRVLMFDILMLTMSFEFFRRKNNSSIWDNSSWISKNGLLLF